MLNVNKTLLVNKISKESFNKLMDLGYNVKIVQTTDYSTPYGKYTYNHTVRPIDSYRQPQSCTILFSCRICKKVNCLHCR